MPMAVWGVDDIERLEDETLRTGDHAATAAQLASIADTAELRGVSRAAVLTRAGEQWQLGGEPATAVEVYQHAVDDGGFVYGDARSYLADALFEVGREEEARSLLARIRADRPRDPTVYHCVAETLEAQRDLAGAAEWATEGVSLVLGDEPVPDFPLDILLRARFRVRRDMGLPEDEYDHMLDDAE